MPHHFQVDLEAMKMFVKVLGRDAEVYSDIASKLLETANSIENAYDSEDNHFFVNHIRACAGDLHAVAKTAIMNLMKISEQISYDQHVSPALQTKLLKN